MEKPRVGQRSMEVELMLPIQTYDIDFAGVVSNIVYIRWLEDLRCAIMAEYLPLQKLLKDGIAPMITQTRIDYKKSISIFEQPMGRMWVSKMKVLKLTVTAEILVLGKVAAIAEQTGCFINLSSRTPIPIPQELSQAYLIQR